VSATFLANRDRPASLLETRFLQSAALENIIEDAAACGAAGAS